MHKLVLKKWIWMALLLCMHWAQTAIAEDINQRACHIDWQPSQQSSIALNTHWCASTDDKAAGQLSVPSFWMNQSLSDKPITATGELRYRLSVRHGEIQPQTLTLRVPRPYDSMRVSINGAEQLSTGDYSPSGDRARRPHYVLFAPSGRQTDIEIWVSNQRFVSGGLREAPVLGFADAMQSARVQSLAFEAFQSGLLFLMAFIQFFQFAQQRHGQQAGLYFGITSFCIAVFAGTGGEHWINYGLLPFGFDPELSLRWALMAVCAWAMAEYIQRLYPEVANPLIIVISRVTVAVFLLACLLAPPRPLAYMFWGFEAMLLLIAGYFMWCLYQAAQRRLPDARIFLAFYALLYVGISHDVLVDYLGFYNGNLAPTAMVMCLIAQGLVLSRQNAQAHQRAATLVEQLRSAEKVKDEFLANTSHELRTPLQSIIGLTELESGTDEARSAAKVEQRYQLIGDTARRLSLLVDDLMDLTRMQHEDIVLDTGLIDVASELHTIRALFLPIVRHRELSLQVELSEPGLQVRADRRRLRQILYNLMGNAVKFTDRGEILLSAKTEGEDVVIGVSDTGPGMRAEELAIATQRYVKGLKKAEGVGLGLAITQGLLEAHGSRLHLSSTEGKGTQASFRLPKVAGSPAESAPTALPADTPSEIRASNGTPDESYILVLDDDGSVLFTLGQLLEPLNYPLRLESHADRAFAHIQKQAPALMLLDLMMPGISGFDVLRQLREQYDADQLPIVVLSARGQDKDQRVALQLGANDYLVKPCDGEELKHRLGLQLALKEARAVSAADPASIELPEDPRELLVATMARALDCWQASGHNRTALAELCGQWRVQLDGSTARARTMDKYLSLSSLPKRPNANKVLQTARYVMEHCAEDDASLRAMIEAVTLAQQTDRQAFLLAS